MTKRRVKVEKEIELKAEEQSNKIKLTRIIKQDGANYYVFHPKDETLEMNVDGIEPEIIVLWYNPELALEKEAYKIENKYYLIA